MMPIMVCRAPGRIFARMTREAARCPKAACNNNSHRTAQHERPPHSRRRRRPMTAMAAPAGPSMKARFANFREFYPYYLAQHANRTSRRLHLAGSLLALAGVALALASGHWAWLLAAALAGSLPAWRGGFFFQPHLPAPFP